MTKSGTPTRKPGEARMIDDVSDYWQSKAEQEAEERLQRIEARLAALEQAMSGDYDPHWELAPWYGKPSYIAIDAVSLPVAADPKETP